jgi:hypothetical protein
MHTSDDDSQDRKPPAISPDNANCSLGYLGKLLKNISDLNISSSSNDTSYKLRHTFYSCMLASLKKDHDSSTGDDVFTITLTCFSKQWKTFMKCKEKTTCMTLLQGMLCSQQAKIINHTIIPPNSSTHVFSDQTSDLLDAPFVNALFQPYFLTSMADLHTLGNNYFASPPLDHAYKSAQHRAALLKAQRYRDALVDNSLIDPDLSTSFLTSPSLHPRKSWVTAAMSKTFLDVQSTMSTVTTNPALSPV